MAKLAITGNQGHIGTTSDEMLRMWHGKYDRYQRQAEHDNATLLHRPGMPSHPAGRVFPHSIAPGGVLPLSDHVVPHSTAPGGDPPRPDSPRGPRAPQAPPAKVVGDQLQAALAAYLARQYMGDFEGQRGGGDGGGSQESGQAAAFTRAYLRRLQLMGQVVVSNQTGGNVITIANQVAAL